MGYQLWSQDNFSKGELSPYAYARAQLAQYYEGLKRAQNVLSYPTGAAGKRFGTLFQAILDNIDSANEIYFATFQWYDLCVFQLVISPTNIAVYLEGTFCKNITTTLDAHSVFNLSTTVLQGAFRFAGQGFKPKDVTLSADSANVITGVSSDTFTLTTAVTEGLILPVQFTNVGVGTFLPTTVPQIKEGVTYFLKYLSTSTAAIYSTAYNAKFDIDRYTLTNAGTGTNNLFQFNDWNVNDCVFKNLPFYDFVGGYDALNFTPSAVTGNAVTITVSSAFAPLTSAYIGGAFIGGGGSGRITAVASTTSFTVAVSTPFSSTAAIHGSLALLAEPAWSDARGWPQKCSSYQNRALFANNDSLPNGFWASVINDYTDFGDLTTDDDDAISWYPSSDNVNAIRFIVPFRSITVHTNTGIYSSPLSEISAITPKTFTLQLQDSTPASVLQPQAIDNQVIVISGNDVYTMVWDGINNAYTTNIVSIVNEQTIRNPVDETAFADLNRAGSRYVFIVNESGSMAVYQTLVSEAVSGFTPQILEQSYGESKFLQVASSADGRCWFVTQRELATEQADIPITGFLGATLTAVGSDFDTEIPTAIQFNTTGTFPSVTVGTPTIAADTWYWAIGVDVDTFKVYASQEDALEDENEFGFMNAGTNSNVTPWPLETNFILEELTQDVHLDCAVYYNSTPTDTIATGTLFNAQEVKMVGDGYGFETVGMNDEVEFVAHGMDVDVSVAYIGFPINYIVETMPLAPPPGAQTSLTKPTHIRSARFMFNNTIGGTINGVPIALKTFDEIPLDEPPVPARGIFEMGLMSGWDDFNTPSFTIEHNDPFNIELIGVFYSMDT